MDKLAQAAHLSDGFSGRQLIDRFPEQGEDSQLITRGILCMVEQELLFRPHPESLDLL